jgi:coatomer subunit beta'
VFQILWSGSGTLVTITSEDSYYVLRFKREAYNEKIEAGADLGDEGVEEAFDLVAEISEKYITRFPNPISDN